jgi:outer membrane protein TolC
MNYRAVLFLASLIALILSLPMLFSSSALAAPASNTQNPVLTPLRLGLRSANHSASDKSGDADRPSIMEPGTNNEPIAPASDVIQLPKPELNALISIDEQMNPYELEASAQRSISLRQALLTAVEKNLDIGIVQNVESTQKWTYFGSLGKFLPSTNLVYLTGYTRGTLNLPLFTQTNAGGSTTAPAINSAINVAAAGLTYQAYQGGKVVFGALQNRNLFRAAKASSRATVSDTLLRVTQNYYNLVLSEALLQIRIRAVETSTEQLRINSNLFENGLATNLDVLQSKTQLSRDRQDLITQQVSRRTAAITLADTLNMQLADDLVPAVRYLRKVRLVSSDLKIGELLSLAIDNRPELRQYEELRKAAKKAIIVATAPLQPTAGLSGYIVGAGPHLSDLDAIYALFFNVGWKLNNLGTVDFAKVQSSRYEARQRLLEANRELNTVLDQVRTALLNSVQSEKKILETIDEVNSASEELRLAKLRFENGLGTNIDIINAQRDLTTAEIDHAQAIINFNIAQAQLLHDTGLTSVDALTSSSPTHG